MAENIPRIIHQMWIGDKSKRPVELMHTWKVKNPSCEYVLWTEKELEGFEFQNRALIDKMPELNGKCDIMRYEILQKYGGIFVDADSECINELDDFFFVSRFACWENEKCSPHISCAFMGCGKDDEAFQLFIDELGLIHDVTTSAWKVCGPEFFTKVISYHNIPITVYPSWYFIPEHGTGETYDGTDKIYARHYWGTTFESYGERLNDKNIRDSESAKRTRQNREVLRSL